MILSSIQCQKNIHFLFSNIKYLKRNYNCINIKWEYQIIIEKSKNDQMYDLEISYKTKDKRKVNICFLGYKIN